MSRRRLSPTQWLDEGPAEHVTNLGSGSVQAATIRDMRPVLTYGGIYVENRSRTKAPQAFSIHIENRK